MKSKNPEVAKLQSKIEMYNMSIEDDGTDPKAYNLKADALRKIGEITKEGSYNEEALKYYSKAIELDSQNPVYLANRSKLYIEMNKPELAVEDIEQVKNLPQSSNAMTAIYLKQVVNKVIALNKAQNAEKKLPSPDKSTESTSNKSSAEVKKEESTELAAIESTTEQNIGDTQQILGLGSDNDQSAV